MGKLIRNGIEYGGGNGTDIFEVTQAEYDALVQAGTLVHNALYVITDAPNLNETAKQISYDGGTATVWNKVEAIATNLSEKVTRECIVVCGATANGLRRLDINLNTIGTRTVTINSILTAGDTTDHKSKFKLDNRTAQGTFGLYTTDTSIVSGRPYIVNFTLS